nr:uncharacterized protein LOC127301105 [Lolium perenne]
MLGTCCGIFHLSCTWWLCLGATIVVEDAGHGGGSTGSSTLGIFFIPWCIFLMCVLLQMVTCLTIYSAILCGNSLTFYSRKQESIAPSFIFSTIFSANFEWKKWKNFREEDGYVGSASMVEAGAGFWVICFDGRSRRWIGVSRS